MARPTTEKICIMCGKPFLPTGGRQKRCPDCKGDKPRTGRNTLTAAARAAAELGISYGKYVAMSEEERNRAREEKTMAEQEKQTAEVTAEPEQAQDTLQEYIRYLNQQEVELQTRLEHIRIALEEAAAYDGVRHSGWRQHKKPPHRRQPVTGAWVKNNHTYHTTNGGICQMKTEKTVTCHSDSYVYATAIESIRHDDTLDKVTMRDILRRLIADFDKAVIADKEKAAFEEACRRG